MKRAAMIHLGSNPYLQMKAKHVFRSALNNQALALPCSNGGEPLASSSFASAAVAAPSAPAATAAAAAAAAAASAAASSAAARRAGDRRAGR